jgi:uncharacterized protein (DUF433 family)
MRTLKETETPVTLTAMAKVRGHDRIASDPKILGGKPVIKGTRVPVYIIVSAIGAGEEVDEVCRGYRLSKADVRAAMAYAADALSRERGLAVPRR